MAGLGEPREVVSQRGVRVLSWASCKHAQPPPRGGTESPIVLPISEGKDGVGVGSKTE